MYALKGNETVLLLRLGAMGDILHALPAVHTLRQCFPFLRLHWLVKPQWLALLEGNPCLNQVIPYRRNSFASLAALASQLHTTQYDLSIDLQGLIQSALLGCIGKAKHRVGYGRSTARESLAALFYHSRLDPEEKHIVDKHLSLVRALGARLASRHEEDNDTTDERFQPECWLPEGTPDGDLPEEPFVLAAPLAGWPGKQWPLENYPQLARLLMQKRGLPLVLNVAERDRERISALSGVHVHCSSLAGLIHATRRATAVLGLDSGPLHLAAALGRPGVALFGPTDPARNGPYPPSRGTIRVLRTHGAPTSYKRDARIAESMRQLSPELVCDALLERLDSSPNPPSASQEGTR